MASLFTKIVNGEIPCYKIAETKDFLAFLDINPNAVGHSLCIPKKEVDQLFELEDALYLGLMAFSKKVAQGLQATVPCKRIGLAVVGLEVPHVHVHLVPINNMTDIQFTKKVALSSYELSELATKIGAAIKL